MHRLVLLQASDKPDQNYEVIWGNYFQRELAEDLILEVGRYILLSLGEEVVCHLQLLLDNRESIVFRSTKEKYHKTRELLMQTFPECMISKDAFYSDRSKGQEYARTVHMNIGLVIEIYENIYPHEAKFEDEDEVKEDIKLLFPELYTDHQLNNRLSRGERVVKFFGI